MVRIFNKNYFSMNILMKSKNDDDDEKRIVRYAEQRQTQLGVERVRLQMQANGEGVLNLGVGDDLTQLYDLELLVGLSHLSKLCC